MHTKYFLQWVCPLNLILYLIEDIYNNGLTNFNVWVCITLALYILTIFDGDIKQDERREER